MEDGSLTIPPDLTADERGLLLRIARESLTRYAASKEVLCMDAHALTKPLRERRGAFVTLHSGKRLRGCIGYIRTEVTLAETVRDNAINAGFRDPRFQPVSAGEIASLSIEISALRAGESPGSPFIRVTDLNEVQVGRDGLYLEHLGGFASGLLLPQVPLEYGWDLDDFLDALCRKAGVPQGSWKRADFRLSRFSAEVFGEGSAPLPGCGA